MGERADMAEGAGVGQEAGRRGRLSSCLGRRQQASSGVPGSGSSTCVVHQRMPGAQKPDPRATCLQWQGRWRGVRGHQITGQAHRVHLRHASLHRRHVPRCAPAAHPAGPHPAAAVAAIKRPASASLLRQLHERQPLTPPLLVDKHPCRRGAGPVHHEGWRPAPDQRARRPGLWRQGRDAAPHGARARQAGPGAAGGSPGVRDHAGEGVHPAVVTAAAGQALARALAVVMQPGIVVSF